MFTAALLHTVCAVAYGVLSVLILVRTSLSRTGLLLAGAALVTAAWAIADALLPGFPEGGLGGGLGLAQAVAWYGFVLHLYLRAAPGNKRLGRLFAAFGLAAAAATAATLPGSDWNGLLLGPVQYGAVARMGLALAGLLLIENLFRGTTDDLRWHVGLPCVALGGLFGYDVLLYADALLFHRLSPALVEGRPAVTALVAPLLAVAAARNRRWGIDLHVSRTVAFHSATLVVGGIFLLGLAAAGEVFRRLGADWGLVAEISLIFGGLIAMATLLTSGSARSRLRGLLVDHFYSHRFDYRREWMRCIATLSAPDTYVALHTRVIQAVANIVDSPGGVLFLREAGGEVFRWAGSWNMPAVSSALLADHPPLPLLRGGAWIAKAERGIAPWVEELPEAWLAVPLDHAGRLDGFILTARPRAAFKLDREVFELLRVIGRLVATFVAEQRATEALLQARELQEYGQRFTFVAHDIKNLSSQLSLLLANAEHHIGNPEFQADMLATIRASVGKIGTTLARLAAPAQEAAQTAVVPADRLAAIVDARRQVGTPVVLQGDGQAGSVVMPAAAFDAVIAHLLDNAIEASPPGGEVQIRLRHEERRALVDIADRGSGMTPEFIRDTLFKPFGSSKQGGFGIGVFQARELLREAGGDLLVISRPGLGTTMRLLLPLVGRSAEKTAPLSA